MSFYAPKFNFDEKSLLFWNTHGVQQDNVYITLLSQDTGKYRVQYPATKTNE